jgi:hypothetical protein
MSEPAVPDLLPVQTDEPKSVEILSLRHWSLERSATDGYLLGLTTQAGAKLVLRLRSLDIFGMAQAVLDDLDRSREPTRLQ